MLGLLPPATLFLFLAPVLVGLAGTLQPAFGYLPAIGAHELSLGPWRSLFDWPGFGSALRLTVSVGGAGEHGRWRARSRSSRPCRARAMTLSGGQRARVALMRVLLSQPRALLLDEPFSKLDTELRGSFRAMVFEQARLRSLPVPMVTHHPQDAEAARGSVVTL